MCWRWASSGSRRWSRVWARRSTSRSRDGIKKGLPPTKALVVASDGAGALVRAAAAAGRTALVEALLNEGASPLVADARANTPLHAAAAGGHVAVCRALLARGADKS